MLMRLTFLCAAVAALTACSSVVPATSADSKVTSAPAAVYPSEHNQFRELGWE